MSPLHFDGVRFWIIGIFVTYCIVSFVFRKYGAILLSRWNGILSWNCWGNFMQTLPYTFVLFLVVSFHLLHQKKWINISITNSINQPVSQSVSQSTHQPTDQPTYRPTKRPTNQPTYQPANQPTNHSTNQSVNQSAKPNSHISRERQYKTTLLLHKTTRRLYDQRFFLTPEAKLGCNLQRWALRMSTKLV